MIVDSRMMFAYHDVRAPPKDYNRLDRHSRTVSFVHSHVRSSLAYIFSGAAQGACALRVTVGHLSMSDVSLTSIHECHSRTPQHVWRDLCSAMTVSIGHLGMSDILESAWK